MLYSSLGEEPMVSFKERICYISNQTVEWTKGIIRPPFEKIPDQPLTEAA